MAVENDVNIFGETIDDPVDLRQRSAAFEGRAGKLRAQKDPVKRPADPEIFFHDCCRAHPQPGGRFAEDNCTLRSR
jgi:hypothetical protein